MDKNKKNNYNTPLVKVVSFMVENGFDATLRIGDKGDPEEHIEPTAGTETYGSESWTARPFSQE